MKDFILLMHGDAPPDACEGGWDAYFARLRASGRFDGGSSVGRGQCFRKTTPAPASLSSVNGFLRVRAEDLEDAQTFLAGNPVYEAGGTVEIRELPTD
jgi:hypothetical protein